jgi:BirA family biotin operon repressor/biotin-[acetyl-CoA-carboxylase] ligase
VTSPSLIDSPDFRALESILIKLAGEGAVPRSDWPQDLPEPESFGLSSSDGLLRLPEGIDLLDSGSIESALSRSAAAWLKGLTVYKVIGSTNAEAMAVAAKGGVDGQVYLAELQVSGRGRRGRDWYSPFAGNLALSMGFRSQREAGDLGGLSLVVGLALLDALEQRGISGLALKWPNDLLLEGAKLGGILIEIAGTVNGPELVIGIGLNIRLPPATRARLDQAVADIGHTEIAASRNLLAAGIISSVHDFVDEFQQQGFMPFADVFNARHYLHGAGCQILQGSVVETGWVDGVTEQGALRLRKEGGEIRVFHGGEVSLRPLP